MLIRPELAARLHPWREVLSAVALIGAGLWMFSWGGWIYGGVGVGMVAVGVIWGMDARRRMRFRRDIAAPGVVELVEGAIRYYGARTLSGEIALRDLAEIRLLRLGGQAHWRLRATDGQALLVPVDAAGAAQLADAFAALPGFDLGAAADALEGEQAVCTVWRRT